MQGKLISHLSTNLTTSATGPRPTESSLALTSLPSNDYGPPANSESVYNESVDSESADNELVYNVSAYAASVNSAFGVRSL